MKAIEQYLHVLIIMLRNMAYFKSDIGDSSVW